MEYAIIQAGFVAPARWPHTSKGRLAAQTEADRLNEEAGDDECGYEAASVVAVNEDLAENSAIAAAKKILLEKGYELRQNQEDPEEFSLFVETGPDEDVDDSIDVISIIVKPLGCIAEWDGYGETGDDGFWISGVRVFKSN